MHLIKFVRISKLIFLACALAHVSTFIAAQENADDAMFGRVGSPGWAPSFPGRGDEEFIEYTNENEIEPNPSSPSVPAPDPVPPQPQPSVPVEPETPIGRNDLDIFETTPPYEPPPPPSPPPTPWYERVSNYAKKKWNEFKYRLKGYRPL